MLLLTRRQPSGCRSLLVAAALLSLVTESTQQSLYSFAVALSDGSNQVVWSAVNATSVQYLVQVSASADFSNATILASTTTPTPLCANCTTEFTYNDTSSVPSGRRLLASTSFYRVEAIMSGAVVAASQASQPRPTDAVNFYVYPAPFGTSNPACGSWSAPCSTLALGISNAPNASTLWVGPGTYTGPGNQGLSFAGKQMHLATLSGAANTVLDLGGTGRAFTFTTEDVTTTVTGLTIQNGAAGAGGGAILISGHAQPYISDCTFLNNVASAGSLGGGAVLIQNNNGIPYFVACTFTNNSAPSGGAVAVDDSTSNPYPFNAPVQTGITLSFCYFSGNRATQTGAGRGGALYATNAVLYMNDLWVTGNDATLDGGAMHMENSGSGVPFTNITLISNTAQTGAALNSAASSLTFQSSAIIGNVASLYCGGVFSFYSGVTLMDSQIVGNSGVFGGGGLKAYQGYIGLTRCLVANNTSVAGAGLQLDQVEAGGYPPASVVATDTVFEGNVASQTGGAISAASMDLLLLTNVNLTSNVAPSGGAIWVGGGGRPASDLTSISGSAFTKNTANYGGAVYASPRANVSVSTSSFVTNTAKAAGGALLADDNTSIQLAGSSFLGNGNYSSFDAPQSGGAISLGINEFKVLSSSAAVAPASVTIDSCQFSNNVAITSGGAINVISGVLSMINSDVDSNTAGASALTTGVGGGIFLQDYCTGGTCTSVATTIMNSLVTNNYAHLAGGGLFYDGSNAGSLLQMNSTNISSNFVDSFLTGSTTYGLGGGLVLLQNRFALKGVALGGNSAYTGGAIFVGADLSSSASLDTLTFTSNAAALGSSVYWLRARSPNAALACTNCVSLPPSNASISTEPLTLAFVQPPPASVVSAQTSGVFSVGLEDYYGQLSSATSSGTCQITSPSPALLLTEQGRFSGIQNGVAVFSQFEVSGGIGNSYVLSTTCAPSTAGQLSYMPSTVSLPVLALPVTVALCGPGTEQIGAFCKQCALGSYDFDGKTCLSCPYGGFCPGGTNGQVTPLKSQQNFWRSSTNATQLYACPTGSCKGTPYYSGDAVGDAACLNGTRGPVCAVCDTGYYLFSGGCASCQKVGHAMLVLAAIVIFFGLILIFCFDLPGGDDVGGGPMTKYKLIMTHFQLMSLLRDYDVTWPSLTISLLSYSDVFNVGVSIVAPPCFVKGFNFFSFYITTLAEPALAFMLCIAVYCVAHLAWTWLKRHEHDDEMPRMCGLVQLTPQKHAKAMTYITSMKGRCYKNIFYLITLVYPRCAQTCLQLFSYMKLDVGTYLYADFTILVRDIAGHWGHHYIHYVPPGIALLVLFAIGVPFWYLYIMWSIRGRLQEEDIKQRFGFLYGGYSFQYWETVDMFRKLVLGGIPVFIAVQPNGSLQAILGELVLVATMGATIYFMPFLDFWDNVISIASMAVLWLVLLTGEMMKWAHFGTLTDKAIAAAHVALTSGVAGVVFSVVAYQLSRKAIKMAPEVWKKGVTKLRKWFPGRFNKVADENTEMAARDSSVAEQEGGFIHAIRRKDDEGAGLDPESGVQPPPAAGRESMSEHLLLPAEDDEDAEERAVNMGMDKGRKVSNFL